MRYGGREWFTPVDRDDESKDGHGLLAAGDGTAVPEPTRGADRLRRSAGRERSRRGRPRARGAGPDLLPGSTRARAGGGRELCATGDPERLPRRLPEAEALDLGAAPARPDGCERRSGTGHRPAARDRDGTRRPVSPRAGLRGSCLLYTSD